MLYFIAMCTEKPINVSTAYYIKTSEILIFHIKMLKRKRLKPFLEKWNRLFSELSLSLYVYLKSTHFLLIKFFVEEISKLKLNLSHRLLIF